MKYPMILFEVMSLAENIEWVKWAYNLDDDLLSPHYYTLELFPELKSISKDASENIKNSIIEKIVTIHYNEHKDEIKKAVERYREIWKSYNDKYFEVLTNYLKADFDKNLSFIHVLVGLMPVNPRNLEDCSFSLNINLTDEELIEKCAHETCHFVWFNKWKELYPNCPSNLYDSPNIPWRYSEMVVDPILNSEEIQKVIGVECRAYDNFYKMTDNNMLVMENLKKIYNTNDIIEHKIVDGYTYVSELFENKNCKII